MKHRSALAPGMPSPRRVILMRVGKNRSCPVRQTIRRVPPRPGGSATVVSASAQHPRPPNQVSHMKQGQSYFPFFRQFCHRSLPARQTRRQSDPPARRLTKQRRLGGCDVPRTGGRSGSRSAQPHDAHGSGSAPPLVTAGLRPACSALVDCTGALPRVAGPAGPNEPPASHRATASCRIFRLAGVARPTQAHPAVVLPYPTVPDWPGRPCRPSQQLVTARF